MVQSGIKAVSKFELPETQCERRVKDKIQKGQKGSISFWLFFFEELVFLSGFSNVKLLYSVSKIRI